jgi:hypothetical protein
MKLANNLTLDNILASIKSSYKQKFSKQQIKELIEGYKEGAEIRAYADPRIPDHLMYPIRYALIDFGNPSDYEAFRKRIVKYIKDGYYKGQVTELANGLLTGVNVSLYEDLSLNRFAMSIIRKNLERGVDVSLYTRESFYVSQVEEIAKGLYLGLDVSCYANKDFTPQQMRLIRIGLEEGLDVTRYADPTLSEYEMNCRLDELRHPIVIGGDYV